MAGILIPASSDLRTSSLWNIMLGWLAEAQRLRVQWGVPFQDTVSFPQYQDLELALARPLVSPSRTPAWLSSAAELHLSTIALSENEVYLIPQ